MNNNEKYKALTKSVMFDLDEKVLEEFKVFFDEHMKDLESLKSINTDGVSPMVRIDSTPISYMREDEVKKTISKEAVLSNASETYLGYVVLPKKGDANDQE